ncbi:interleukin-20-like isoform X9 [Podarcis muralis]
MQVFFSLFLYLLLPPVLGDRFFQFGPCSISMNIHEIRDGFGTIKKVIQARDPIRTASILHPHSLHNFQDENMCNCGEEAINKYHQIIRNYEQMDVTLAAMKALGELDILLNWLEAY